MSEVRRGGRSRVRSSLRATVTVLVLAVACVAGTETFAAAVDAPAGASATGNVGTFAWAADSPSGLDDLVGGPDGAVWVADTYGARVWRYATDGLLLDVIPTGAGVGLLTLGPDGNVWGTSAAADAVVRITPAGVVTWFWDPTIADPLAIVAGPDGALWFTNAGNDSVGRVTTAGVVTNVVTGLDRPTTLAFLPDGDLWIGGYGTDGSGSITRRQPDGTTTRFVTRGVWALVAGPGDVIWFLEDQGIGWGGSLETIDADGTIEAYDTYGWLRDLVVGPDGNVWVTDFGQYDPLSPPYGAGSIHRIRPDGQLDWFATTGYGPGAITVGPDGNVWVANDGKLIAPRTYGGASLSRLTPDGAGTAVDLRSLDSPHGIVAAPDGSGVFVAHTGRAAIQTIGVDGEPTNRRIDLEPWAVAAGPDGTVWSTGPLLSDPGTRAVARLSPDGTTATFTDAQLPDPRAITAGPDGHVWFLTGAGDAIGRVAPDGSMTRFDDPQIDTAGERDRDIVRGPDGNLWFANQTSIGRITPDGVVTTYAPPDGVIAPEQLAFDTVGNLWFTDAAHHALGRRDPVGAFTTVIVDDRIVAPHDLAVDPLGGGVWFTNDFGVDGGSIGYLGTSGALRVFRTGGHPWGLAAGPGGDVWVTWVEGSASRMGTTVAPAVPSIPPSLTASSLGSGRIRASWPASDDPGSSPVTKYVVTAWLRGAAGTSAPVAICTATAPALSCTFDDLPAASWVDLTVRAVNAVGSTAHLNSPVATIQVPFRDLPLDAPFGEDIAWMAWARITSGYADGTFRPALPVSRLAMAAFLYRSNWSPAGTNPTCTDAPFTDVPVGSPFCGEVAQLKAQGVLVGFPDGSFHPGATVTREAMAAFLYRRAGNPDGEHPSCASNPFADVATGAPFCGEIAWLRTAGIANGYADGTFHPHEPIARQAMAAFLHRVDQLP